MTFYNRVYCSTATSGTGSVTPGAAIAGGTPNFLSFANAAGGSAIPASTTITYELEQGADFELGRGVWNGTLFTRNVLISCISGVVSTTTKLSLNGTTSNVRIIEAAEDIVSVNDNNSLSGTLSLTNGTAATVLGTGTLIISGTGGASINGNLFVGNAGSFAGNLALTGIMTATAKGHTIGSAGGNAATGALVPGDANNLGYNSGSGNWSGWGIDNNGFFWIRTGLSGTGPAALYCDNTTNTFATGSLKSSSATGGVGYATGAGGTVAQATSKSTGVTLNKVSGQITMVGLALAANTTVSFVLTNSAIAATDTVDVQVLSGTATVATYQVWAEKSTAGTVTINVRNISAGSLSESVVLQFNVIKGVNS